MEQSFHARSISMPTGTHPASLNVEEEIQKLSLLMWNSGMTTEMMLNGFKSLENLYFSIEDLLHLPSIQQDMCRSNQRRLLEEEVDASIRLLDIFISTKDVLVTLKEDVQDLQSELRRKGNQATAEKLRCCMRIRKEAKKMVSVCNKESSKCSPKSIVQEDYCEASEAMKALSEARKIVLSLLCSILSSMSGPKSKSGRWSFVSKVIQKRSVSCEEAYVATECTYSSLYASLEDMNGHQLEVLQESLGNLQNGLVCLYKRLIQNRVSLLNIISM